MDSRNRIILNKQFLLKASIVLYAIKYFFDISTLSVFEESFISDLLIYFSLGFVVLYIGISIIEKGRIKAKIFVLILLLISIGFIIRLNISYTLYVMHLLYLIAALFCDRRKMLSLIANCAIAMLSVIAAD